MDQEQSKNNLAAASGITEQVTEDSGSQESEGAQNDVSTMVYKMLGCGTRIYNCK